MSEARPALFPNPMEGLSWSDWLGAAAEMVSENGSVEPLGPDHAAIHLDQGRVLLVSFEAHHRIDEVSETGQPMGWKLAEALGWSHLCLACRTDTWFRDPRVFGYFDRLIDHGFFEAFDTVIFYGAGSCGYAAAAFSVASPGARVLAIQPQATLDPRVTEWDDRFTWMRRTAFDDRFGYAPDMLDAASRAFVLYDPEIDLDSMHAALFTRENVTLFRMRHMGEMIDASLMRMNILLRLLAQLSADKLTTRSLAQLYRARHADGAYHYALLGALTRDNRHKMVIRLANAVLAQRDAKPFRRALVRAKRRLAGEDSGSGTQHG